MPKENVIKWQTLERLANSMTMCDNVQYPLETTKTQPKTVNTGAPNKQPRRKVVGSRLHQMSKIYALRMRDERLIIE